MAKGVENQVSCTFTTARQPTIPDFGIETVPDASGHTWMCPETEQGRGFYARCESTKNV